MASTCAISTISMCSRTPPAPRDEFFSCEVAVRMCCTPDSRIRAFDAGLTDSDSTVPSVSTDGCCWAPGSPNHTDCDSDDTPTSYCTPSSSALSSEDQALSQQVEQPINLPQLLASTVADLLIQSASDTAVSPLASSFACDTPILPMHAFLDRIVYYSGLSVAPYAGALMLIDRLDSRVSGLVAPNTIHRLFLTCLSIAHKAVEEYQIRNSTIAAIGGISMPELKACEMELVTLLDWELGFNDDELNNYLSLLQSEAGVSAPVASGFLGA